MFVYSGGSVPLDLCLHQKAFMVKLKKRCFTSGILDFKFYFRKDNVIKVSSGISHVETNGSQTLANIYVNNQKDDTDYKADLYQYHIETLARCLQNN